jgi:hypothetical protein
VIFRSDLNDNDEVPPNSGFAKSLLIEIPSVIASVVQSQKEDIWKLLDQRVGAAKPERQGLFTVAHSIEKDQNWSSDTVNKRELVLGI